MTLYRTTYLFFDLLTTFQTNMNVLCEQFMIKSLQISSITMFLSLLICLAGRRWLVL